MEIPTTKMGEFQAIFGQLLIPENIYFFKVNNRKTRKRCELYWKVNDKDNRTMCPSNINLFKVNNRNYRKRREICSKLIIKTLDVIDVALVFLLITLNIFHIFF